MRSHERKLNTERSNDGMDIVKKDRFLKRSGISWWDNKKSIPKIPDSRLFTSADLQSLGLQEIGNNLQLVVSKMSVSQFLAGLPSYNEDNFSKFHIDGNGRISTKRPSVYIPTKDIPPEQIIVTEKTSILLKYMQQHWDKKNVSKKREISTVEEPARKRIRLDVNHS